MPNFQSKPFESSTAKANNFAAKYRFHLRKHPFLLFGLPFVVTIVAGSFFLTPATALRYERHDRKVRQLTTEETLSLGKNRRKVDIREEYYRIMSKTDIDDWEQKRVERLPGEHDGIL
ncbi:cytochrome c oxidase-assembly factor COX16 [Lepidopterella palustris CBS 459.81]|uniref:Cytochrome c oxidase assembly protein COX16, mitochondrial n=1 Tax=Lepidopterella palustris CBS 459.81 TaxID=1314670 RepID=A0A8E2JHI1_9PEZI|nr:cytochrome c oxidase-assembly factor COX16 [Lepidopterella palustris CBS 459.81]